MNLAIAILNWNGRSLLEKYLPSVVEHSQPNTIYVVDNASDDDSVGFVKQEFPDVRLIEFDRNYGYAGGYNLALSQIKEELVILLNSDVRVTAGWCKPLVAAFEQQPKLAACQPKILDDKCPDLFEYAGASGGFLDKLGYPYCRGRIFDSIEQDKGQYDDPTDIHWASGAALMVNRVRFLEIGGFDESYFAHQEEIDLCWRFRRLGFKVQVIPDSVVYHLGGATLSTESPRKTYLNFRNSLVNLVKNAPQGKWIILVFLRMLLDGIQALRFLTSGDVSKFSAVFRAHIAFYGRVGDAVKKRRAFIGSTCDQIVEPDNFPTSSIVYAYFIRGRKRFSDL